MTESQIILTYFKLSERERKEHFPDSSTAAFLKKKIFASGYAHFVILRDDGTAAAMGDDSSGQCGVSGWKDVVKVAAGDFHTVGLKKDGTVLAVGKNDFGQCNVTDWKDVIDIFAEKALTIGVTKDQTILVTHPDPADAKTRVNPGKNTPDTPKKKPAANGDPVTSSPFVVQIENGWLTVKDYLGNDTRLVIPSQIEDRLVEAIGAKAFSGKRVESVTLPKTLKKIDESAFRQCKDLKQIRIPDNVTIIDRYAFYGCEKLETVVMPKGLTFLGEGAFYQCPALKHVYMTVEARKRIKSWLGVSFEDASIVTVGEFMSS